MAEAQDVLVGDALGEILRSLLGSARFLGRSRPVNSAPDVVNVSHGRRVHGYVIVNESGSVGFGLARLVA